MLKEKRELETKINPNCLYFAKTLCGKVGYRIYIEQTTKITRVAIHFRDEKVGREWKSKITNWMKKFFATKKVIHPTFLLATSKPFIGPWGFSLMFDCPQWPLCRIKEFYGDMIEKIAEEIQ